MPDLPPELPAETSEEPTEIAIIWRKEPITFSGEQNCAFIGGERVWFLLLYHSIIIHVLNWKGTIAPLLDEGTIQEDSISNKFTKEESAF
jgi:hypothetical protein